MAKSKFSDIYKQELNSKGVMSSLGSAALKQTRERMDIRNSLFGGTGAISRTGQKIFGKGYSATGGNAARLSGRSNSPIQGASLDALVISNQKQERLLKIVAKNTMNMNMMARDMNITRQNIVSLTRKVTGKSAKGSDAMYMNANRRNAQVDGMPKRGAAPGASGGIMSSIFGGIGSVLSGGAGIIGSVVSGLLGVVGGVGGGILSAIGGILGGIPGGWLLGTIALAGIAYLLKEVAANTDFKGLKDDILKGLGFDPGTSFSQQLLVKMGFTEATSKNIVKTLSNFSDSMYNFFLPTLNSIGEGFAEIIDITKVHISAGFAVLQDTFGSLGKVFGFLFNEFFQENKGKILAGLTLGLGLGFAKNPAALLGAVTAAGIAGAIGAVTSDETRSSLSEKLKPKMEEMNAAKGLLEKMQKGAQGNQVDQTLIVRRLESEVEELQKKLNAKNKEYNGLFSTNPDVFSDEVERGKAALPKGEYGGGYVPLLPKIIPDNDNSNSPKRISQNQSLLDIIGKAEGSSQEYNASNKGMAGDNKLGTPNLINMTVEEVMAAQARREFFAAGRYQIIPDTLRSLVNKKIVSKDDKFNKETQDKLATALINEALKRAGSDTTKQQLELAKIFAAIADPNTGQSYHRDVGGNKSSITTEQIQQILKNSGADISSSSIQLTDERLAQALYNTGQSAGSTINNITNTNVASSSGSKQYPSAYSNDAAELFIRQAVSTVTA